MNKVVSGYFHRIHKESRTHNSTYPKGGVSFSKDSFVVNQTLVLRMNIGGENRHLCQVRNRQAVKKSCIS